MKPEGHVRLTLAALEKVNRRLPANLQPFFQPHYQLPAGTPEERNKQVVLHILNRLYGYVPVELATGRRDVYDTFTAKHWRESGQQHHFMKRASASEHTSYLEGCAFIKARVADAVQKIRDIRNMTRVVARSFPHILDCGPAATGAQRNPGLLTPPAPAVGTKAFRNPLGSPTPPAPEKELDLFDIFHKIARPAMKAARSLSENLASVLETLIFPRFQTLGDALHCLQDSFSPAHVVRHDPSAPPKKLDARTVAQANAGLWREHPELHGRLLSAGDDDFYDRQEWREHYVEEMKPGHLASGPAGPTHKHAYQIEQLLYYDHSALADIRGEIKHVHNDHSDKDFASGDPDSRWGKPAVFASAELIYLVVQAASKPRNHPWESDWQQFSLRWLRASPDLSAKAPPLPPSPRMKGWRSDGI